MNSELNSISGLTIPKDRAAFSKQVAYLSSILSTPIVLLCITLVQDLAATLTAASYVLLQLSIPLINKSKGFDFLNGMHRYGVVIANYILLLFLSFELGTTSGIHLYFFINIAASLVYLRMNERFMLYSSLILGLVAIMIVLFMDLNPFLNDLPIEQYQKIISYFTLTTFLLFLFIYLYYMVSMMDEVERVNKSKTHNLQAVIRSNDSLIYEIDREYKLKNIWASDKTTIPLTKEQLKNGTDIFELFESSLSEKIKEGVDHVLNTNSAYELQHLSESDGNWYEFKLRPFHRDGMDLRVSMTSQNINHIKKIEQNIDKYDAVQNDILMLMSNVIRTPLNTINTFIERLLQDDPNDKQVTRLKIVKNSSDNILSLINGMIDFYKIEKGTLDIEKNEFDLFKMMHRLEDAFLPEAVKNRVILRVEIDRSIPDELIGAEEKIDQVMANLMQNALKYTEVGKITVSVQMVKRKGKKLFLLFRVKDTGIGINEQKQHLFNNFDNIDLSTIRQFGETGVSLAVSKLLVKVMGGNLELFSEEGKGSRFSFILPLQIKNIEEFEEGEDDVLIDNGELEGKSILIADYDSDAAAEISSICESWGMKVAVVYDGSSVLKKLITNSFDILLMALSLPGMDGYEATARIRASKKQSKRTMPIVALSDDGSKHLFKKIRLAGMNGFVRKPLKNKQLRDVLMAMMVDKRQLYNPEERIDEDGNLVTEPKEFSLD